MVVWFTSLKGALAHSIVALLSFVAYALLVYRYLIDQLMPGIRGAAVQTIFVLILLSGWIWSLYSASLGSRSGLWIAVICVSLPTLFSLYDLVFYSPVPYGWPLVQISVWAMFITGVAAIAALTYQLITWQPAA